MLAALESAGYEYPTPIQAGLIPRVLEGVDVVGQARTGTGKTAAFAIPILERLLSRKKVQSPQAIILTPTRELAVQVRDEVVKLAKGRKADCVALYGGKPIRGQIEKLRAHPQIVVGTPGRVIDHLSRRTLDLSDLRFVVLDEADRMLDIGFRPDIEKILRQCPSERQTLLLSATVPPPIARLAQRYMRDPESLDFSPAEMTVDTIEQFYYTVDPERKFDLLVRLLKREKPQQALVFCRTKRGSEKIYRRLSKLTQHVACLNGDMEQNKRDRVMSEFRAGQTRVLVATDIVGRGIDVSGISHIINYDMPQFSDDYVHRVGRTGRMGREGVAYSFVMPEEGKELTRIEQRINRLLKRDEMPGFDFTRPATIDTAAPQTPEEEPPPPPPSLGGRKKKYRRAL
ncbi:MAG: DEAD/DEAH box helicase [Planctomycetes bacterium]|nr:DEAD/DEAH box helicase [Planctomycetota bacterium]